MTRYAIHNSVGDRLDPELLAVAISVLARSEMLTTSDFRIVPVQCDCRCMLAILGGCEAIRNIIIRLDENLRCKHVYIYIYLYAYT